MSVVSNASPLIVLSAVGLFPKLQDLFQELHITEAIYDEIVVKGKGKFGSREVQRAAGNWIRIHPTPPDKELKLYQQPNRLKSSDASVVALAKQLSANPVIIDELLVRRVAKANNLTVVGTGGLLIRFKRLGYIATLAGPLGQAIEHGLRLGKEVKMELLQRAGESEKE